LLITSLKPIAPPPHPHALPFSSMAKLLQNPQAISLNFGKIYFVLEYFIKTGS
jgi:hypothetical protein